jgi:hypothetical protein
MSKNNLHPMTILPAKKMKQQTTIKVNEPLQSVPMTMCLIAPTSSGKSNVVLNLLKNVNFYQNVFPLIYYISPTILDDKTLTSIAKDETIIKVTDDDDLENLDNILGEIVKSQHEEKGEDREQCLVVLDDMIEYLKESKKVNNLPSLSRHSDLSFMITSQVYNAIPARCRKNATCYLIFHINNKKDLDDINHEIGSNFPDFMKYYKIATEDPYCFLYVDMRKMALYKNFTDLLWQKNKK